MSEKVILWLKFNQLRHKSEINFNPKTINFMKVIKEQCSEYENINVRLVSNGFVPVVIFSDKTTFCEHLKVNSMNRPKLI